MAIKLPELRPRFERETSLSPEEAFSNLLVHLEETETVVLIERKGDWIYLNVNLNQRKVWSPRLSLQLEKEEDEESFTLYGTFGPNPNVWLLFMFGYGFLGFALFIVIIIGWSQWSLNMAAPVLWLIPVLLLGVIGLYFSAKAGQNAAKDQMWDLYEFLHQAMEGRLEVK